MWLLKLHFAVSILMVLSVVGIRMLCGDRIRKNVKLFSAEVERRRNLATRLMSLLRLVIIMMCPIANLIMVLAVGFLALADEDMIKEATEKVRGER